MKRNDVLIRGYSPEVTGSAIECEVHYWSDGKQKKFTFVIDFGFYQGHNHKNLEYNRTLPIENIGAVLITHSHLDHIGAIPCLVRDGYKGKIYMSEGTALLSNLVYEDTYKIMKRDYKVSKKPMQFFKENVDRALNQTELVVYGKTITINPYIQVTFFPNAHLPGASMILVQILDEESRANDINLLFTGDYKAENELMEFDPLPVWVYALPNLTIISEATYGDKDSSEIDYCIEDTIEYGCKHNKVIFLSAFAQGRYQQLMYKIRTMQEDGRIPKDYPIQMDGPSAVNVTFTYLEFWKQMNLKKDIFLFPYRSRFITENEERNAVINRKNRQIIISTSGMMSNGPAKLYMPTVLSNPDALVCVCGYASEGTLARSILETEPGGSIAFGSRFLPLVKRAETMQTFEMSAHATSDQLIEFLNRFNARSILINHGEPAVKKIFAQKVKNETFVKKVSVMEPDKVFKVTKYGVDKIYTRI